MREPPHDEPSGPAPDDETPPGSPEGAALVALVLAPAEAEQLGGWDQQYSELTEARLEDIEDDMRADTYEGRRSRRVYRERWGLSDQRVRELTAIASKRVLADRCAPEEVQRRVTLRLEAAANTARAKGDLFHEIKALQAIAVVNGAVAPKLTKSLVAFVDGRGEGEAGGNGQQKTPGIYVPREVDE